MPEPRSDLLSATVEVRGDAVRYGSSQENPSVVPQSLPLLVLGVQGKTGRRIVQRALEQGHTVTTLSRRPLEIQHARLRVVKGDPSDESALELCMRGQRAALCALGDDGDPVTPDKLAQVLPRLASLLRTFQIRRLVLLVPVTQVAQASSFVDAIRSAMPRPIRGQVVTEQAPDGIDWSLVLCSALTDEPAQKVYEVALRPQPSKRPIPRADVADFMLAEVTEPRHVRQFISVGELPPEGEEPQEELPPVEEGRRAPGEKRQSPAAVASEQQGSRESLKHRIRRWLSW